MQIPTQDKRIIQTNTGDAGGNMKMSYGLDLARNRGKISGTQSVTKAFDTTDLASLDKAMTALPVFGGYHFALADKLFEPSARADPTSTWVETDGSPTFSAADTDAEVFDGLLLVVNFGETDLVSYNGSTFDTTYWTSTLGHSALTGGKKTILKKGPTGKLYISEGATKVISLDTSGAAVRSGAGSLDFSATEYEITCMEVNSTRLFIGMENTAGGDSTVIAEWDMGASTISPNYLHPIGVNAVRAIFVWDDVPYAVLSDGRVLYHNGSTFVDHPTFQFPTVNTNVLPATDFIHHNGWAIIDNMPHLLIKGGIKATGNGGYSDEINSPFTMPAGVWCCDPEIGLYNRYPIGAGTTIDAGQPSLNLVGALCASQHKDTKFLAGISYFYDGSNVRYALLRHDRNSGKEVRSLLMSTPLDVEDVPQAVEAMHKKLTSGDEIHLYFRQSPKDTVVTSGTWGSTSTYHTTDTTTDISVGDVGLVKTGTGAGCLMRVSNKESSASTTVITFKEANSKVTANTGTAIEFHNFKFAGKITGTGKDNENFTLPTTEKTRQVELLVEIRQGANSVVELNNVKIV